MDDTAITRQVVDLKEQVDAGDLDLTWSDIGEAVGLSGKAAESRWQRWKAQNPEDFRSEVANQIDAASESVSVEEHSDNEIVVTSKSTAIKTLAQLVRECDIDLGEWKPVKPLFNAWTTSGLDKATSEWIQIQNYQVKCRFVRREPIAVFPAIKPIQAAHTYQIPTNEHVGGVTRALVAGDVHVGFLRDTRTGRLTPTHDRRAMSIVAQTVSNLDLDLLVLNGDLLDMAEWSSGYRQKPEYRQTMQPALLELHWWLAGMRKAKPGLRMVYIEGNHESRVYRSILDNLEAAYELTAVGDVFAAMSVPHLLALDDLGIEWVGGYEDNEAALWLSDGLRVRHGDTARSPGLTARAVVDGAVVSEINGHIHREERTTETRVYRDGRRTVCSQTFGCLCHMDGRVPGDDGERQWQQGFGLVDVGDGLEAVRGVGIDYDSHRAIVDGQIITGRDYTDALARDLPEWPLQSP